jgi:hypothetical protein
MVQATVTLAVVTTARKLGENWSNDDVVDALDEQGASDERMVDLKAEEAKAFASSPSCSYFKEDYEDLAMGGTNRQAAMWLLANLVEYAGLPEVHLLKAGLFLDILCLRRPGALLNGSIPVLCVALVKIIKKVESSTPDSLLLSLSQYASCLVDRLQNGCGQANAHLDSEDLRDHEAAILDALDWKLELPTTQDWITLTCKRLNVFMFGLLTPMLTPMLDRTLYLAKSIAVSCPASADFLPVRVGQGLLCLSLVSARVLPASAFNLGLSELACPFLDGKQDVKKTFKPESLEMVIQGLELATGSKQDALSEDARFVNMTLLNMQCQNFGGMWGYNEDCYSP